MAFMYVCGYCTTKKENSKNFLSNHRKNFGPAILF